MRIIGGTRRGRKLVEWDESGIRPMRDFVRTALFNIIDDFVDGSRFLDLFCGTGSVGLEALSRGAKTCVFVDQSPEACRIVRRNLDALDFLDVGRVLEGEAVATVTELRRRGLRFDLAFVGPPYGHDLAAYALGALGHGEILSEDSVVVAEIRCGEALADGFGILERADRRRYGDNELHFYRRREGSAGGTEEDEA